MADLCKNQRPNYVKIYRRRGKVSTPCFRSCHGWWRLLSGGSVSSRNSLRSSWPCRPRLPWVWQDWEMADGFQAFHPVEASTVVSPCPLWFESQNREQRRPWGPQQPQDNLEGREGLGCCLQRDGGAHQLRWRPELSAACKSECPGG